MAPFHRREAPNPTQKMLGATFVEYTVLLILVSLLVIAALKGAGQSVSNIFSEASSHLDVQ